MSFKCVECSDQFTVPMEAEDGEIFSCPECGTDFVIEMNDKGEVIIKELNLEEEDWGE